MVVATAALGLTSVRCEQILRLDDLYDCPQDPRCPSCSDGKKNGGETDVDCGGECPNKCAAGGACSSAGDCESGVCMNGKCQPLPGPDCEDGERNGTETGRDCGGGACPACPVGEGCIVGTDCESLACGASHTCVAPQCDDVVKNGNETDVDCGGSCGPCAKGQHCMAKKDCTTSICTMGVCTECTPGATQCSGNTPQTCDGNGQWQDGTACSGTAICAAGACVTPTSCQEGATGAGMDCGPGTNESCCASLLVAGGMFYRSYDGVTTTPDDYTSKAYPATVSSFRLDKYEVTVGRFRQFVNAWVGGWRPAAGAGKHGHLNGGSGLVDSASPGAYETGWDPAWEAKLASMATGWNTNLACDTSYQTWTPSAGGNEKRPVNCVSQYESYAFCTWDGGFLPSEAEWNYAAAGGDEQRVYPWGSTVPGPDSSLAIHYCYYNGSGTCTGTKNIAPVGSAAGGNGKYGQSDLAGNVWEWTLDRYASYVNPCSDCVYLGTTSGPVFRGGSFNATLSLFVSYRGVGVPPTGRNASIGLRCGRTPL